MVDYCRSSSYTKLFTFLQINTVSEKGCSQWIALEDQFICMFYVYKLELLVHAWMVHKQTTLMPGAWIGWPEP